MYIPSAVGWQKSRETYVTPIKKWLKQNCVRRHRTLATDIWSRETKSYTGINLTVFVEDRTDFLTVEQQYKKQIIKTVTPATPEHEDLLSQGVHIEIRHHLYYHKFKYKITFKGIWTPGQIVRQTIKEFAKTQLHDASKVHQDYKLLPVDGILYLSTLDDLMLVKMVLGENIRQVTFAYTSNQIAGKTE